MIAQLTHRFQRLSQKIYWREILAVLLLVIGIYFLRKQKGEVMAILPYLYGANGLWLGVAAAVTLLFVLLQSAMYRNSFAAVATSLPWIYAIELFLKRNLLGVFLPGGGVSALAYVPVNVKKAVQQRTRIHQASGIFAFAGMVSTFIVGLPVLFTSSGSVHWGRSVVGLLVVAVATFLVYALFRSIQGKSRLFAMVEKRFPGLAAQAHQLTDASVDTRQFGYAIGNSVGVELCGIIHLYVAMLAIGAPPSLAAAGIAYIVALLLMVVSPFLKGLGAVELSIVYVLSQFGYSPAQAMAIAVIYRAFEFWLPLFGGLIAFLLKGRQLFVRIAPALSIFVLGVVNIVSVVTPPIKTRLHFVKTFLPADTLYTTNLLVLFIGITLIVTAAFLVKGLRNAWWIAVGISFVSIFGHLVKAFDYEEAGLALFVFVTLVATRKHYRLRGNPRLAYTGARVALLAFVAVLVYGFVGFYFLEKRHFGMAFNWQQSLLASARGFLLLDMDSLHPLTRFGKEFKHSFNIMGLLAWLFLLYTLIRPYLNFGRPALSARQRAEVLLKKYGVSAVDFFKITDDKLLFFAATREGFISYKVSGGFAIVLEEPVCAKEHKAEVVKEFEDYCHKAGLRTAFYRIDESSICYFSQFKKKQLLIGQEALLDVQAFDLTGRSKKSLRNGLNSLQKKGYSTRLCEAPQNPAFLKELRGVSDEWLKTYEKKELVFSQGLFDETILATQDIIATFDEQGRVVAFLNIIPNFAPQECTYDLIRKTAGAPGGCMDALIIELVNYAKLHGFRSLNLGLVPLSGILQPQNAAEQVMKFAYSKVKRFRHYQGLREFKEKYASEWLNKYLVYESDFDLLQLPMALNKVMRPDV